jgi:hypothetical protein
MSYQTAAMVLAISQVFHITRKEFEEVIKFYPEYGSQLSEREKTNSRKQFADKRRNEGRSRSVGMYGMKLDLQLPKARHDSIINYIPGQEDLSRSPLPPKSRLASRSPLPSKSPIPSPLPSPRALPPLPSPPLPPSPPAPPICCELEPGSGECVHAAALGVLTDRLRDVEALLRADRAEQTALRKQVAALCDVEERRSLS